MAHGHGPGGATLVEVTAQAHGGLLCRSAYQTASNLGSRSVSDASGGFTGISPPANGSSGAILVSTAYEERPKRQRRRRSTSAFRASTRLECFSSSCLSSSGPIRQLGILKFDGAVYTHVIPVCCYIDTRHATCHKLAAVVASRFITVLSCFQLPTTL